jgi:hypothetical protein
MEGFRFENQQFDYLKKMQTIIPNDSKILREGLIRSIYGDHISSIDFMFIHKNNIIFIQNKYHNKAISISCINHYINGCKQLKESLHGKYNINGIYVSRNGVTKTAQQSLDHENKHNDIQYRVVSGDNKMSANDILLRVEYEMLLILKYHNRINKYHLSLCSEDYIIDRMKKIMKNIEKNIEYDEIEYDILCDALFIT